MRIAYFALGEEFGAAHAGFVHSYSIAQALAKRGAVVRLFIGSDEGKISHFEQKNLKIIPVTLPRSKKLMRTNPLRYTKSLFRIMDEIKNTDIIHERFHINPIDLLFVGKKKYVLEVNDPAVAFASGVKKRLILKKFSACGAIITQTETLKEILQKHTSKKIFVVPNGVDTSFFRPGIKSNTRKKYGIKGDDILITFVGAFREWHGVQDIPEIAKNAPDAKFLLVGSGPLSVEAAERAKGIKNIILAGSVDYGEIPGIMAASDILIAPFNTSGFRELDRLGFWWCPMKLFEYMASGKPIVSYDFPEVRKIVRGAGLLATPGDTADFTEMLKRLAHDKKLRTALGRKARNIAVANYGWKKRAAEIIKIYRKV